MNCSLVPLRERWMGPNSYTIPAISTLPRKRPNPTPMDDLTPEQLFLDNLDLIERIAAHACRWSRLRPEDKEDFISWVKLKLIEDDYAVLRRYEKRENATLRTFLTVVIN